MDNLNFSEASEFIRNCLRLKTPPVAVKFLKDAEDCPEKARRPSQHIGKRVAICQAVAMTRFYGWTVCLTKDDLNCLPATIAFGFSTASDPALYLARLFFEDRYSENDKTANKESIDIHTLKKDEYGAVLLTPLYRASFEPDTIVIYGNPAQLIRLIHAWVYMHGRSIQGHFRGKVECTEYLLAPFQDQIPCIAFPGTGDRVFSMTQDDEAVFSMPGKFLTELIQALQEVGRKPADPRYPVPVYLNFQPEFPSKFIEMGKEIGVSIL